MRRTPVGMDGSTVNLWNKIVDVCIKDDEEGNGLDDYGKIDAIKEPFVYLKSRIALDCPFCNKKTEHKMLLNKLSLTVLYECPKCNR